MAQGVNEDSIFFYGFQEGEYGTQGPWEVGWGLYRQHLYYKGWWTGENVIRYVNGTLGPRSGLVALNVTGLPNGQLNGLGFAPVPGKSGWCVIGTTLYRFDAETPGSAATSIGTLAVAPTRPLTSVHVGRLTYITNYGDKTYCYDPTAGTLTAIANSPGGSCIAAYLDRLVVGCTSTAGNILWYSDPAPADGSSFLWSSATEASQFIYIGDQWEVRSVTALRTGLAITKQDGSWWMLTGTPGVNDVLRKVWSGLAVTPSWAHRVCVSPDGSVWGVPAQGGYPCYFTGAKAGNLKYLNFMGTTRPTDDGAQHVDVGVAPVFQADELVAVSGNAGAPNAALLRNNGIFSKHQFGVNISGWIAQGTEGRMLLSDGGATGAQPQMYGWRATELDRPNIKGNNLESVGDASDTPFNATFTLPEWRERSGGQVIVREVIVEWTSYNTGVAATNHFDLTVTATRRRTLPSNTPVAEKTSKVYDYDEAGSAVGAVGDSIPRSFAFQVGDQGRGDGFTITFANMRGVAIERIVAKVETEASLA